MRLAASGRVPCVLLTTICTVTQNMGMMVWLLLLKLQKLFMKGYGVDLSKAYLKANMLAAEAVSNMRTVAAFCAEKRSLSFIPNSLSSLQNSLSLVVKSLAYFTVFLNSSSSQPMVLPYGMVRF